MVVKKQTKWQGRTFLTQPSTYAGLLTIAGAVFTGGASALLDPGLLTQIGTGLALILTNEP